MSHQANDLHIEAAREEREQFLSANNATEADVMKDETGEYIITEAGEVLTLPVMEWPEPLDTKPE